MWTNCFYRYEHFCYRYEIFLKENHAIAVDSYYIFTKKMYVEHGIEHDINSAYGGCIHYRHS